MPLINDDKWGHRIARTGPIIAVVGAGLALTAAALLVLALIFLR
ncbi:hypothetical protein [Actinoplanes rectilineatus]|nr:hypothetical protein [Actinoplanes rectilineatus]